MSLFGIVAACEPRVLAKDTYVPVTGVSYRDATAYAAWLSARTGRTWRRPTRNGLSRLPNA
ncbi:SUMF1/EgtB/PvdO family nonheme iron enzyme [Mesorhizobium sp. Root157]|uniref:SUMF1/EgtB/PvdO family nonheme iron enzyme n=1 Tax=Mesorhizobium sp. Root157 TaxID=1736477 RepID=UPI0039B78E69